jgi:hypothetical protein
VRRRTERERKGIESKEKEINERRQKEKKGRSLVLACPFCLSLGNGRQRKKGVLCSGLPVWHVSLRLICCWQIAPTPCRTKQGRPRGVVALADVALSFHHPILKAPKTHANNHWTHAHIHSTFQQIFYVQWNSSLTSEARAHHQRVIPVLVRVIPLSR